MKVLHINSGNLNSGAGKGALNVHLALLDLNIQSRMLCQTPPPKKIKEVYCYSDTFLKRIKRFFFTQFERFHLLYIKRNKKNLFSSSIIGLDLSDHPLVEWADIIHIHWINQGFVSLSLFERIDKPIVWTLRDMWPFTGGCHQSFGCSRYSKGCGSCPAIGSSINFDLSKVVYNFKLKKIKNVHAIGISEWVTELALKSLLFKKNQIDCYTINNIVPVELFKKIEIFNNDLVNKVNSEKFRILVGAQDVSSEYKGYNFTKELFSKMDQNKYHWLSFGDYDISQDFPKGQSNYTHFGFVNDVEKLSKIYSYADVFLSTSIAEAFGKTLVEAQSCGTPVVCFDMCGPKYLVEHKITGYKAIPLNVQDLIDGIFWVQNMNIKEKNSHNIMNFSNNFSKERNILKYVELYSKLLNK